MFIKKHLTFILICISVVVVCLLICFEFPSFISVPLFVISATGILVCSCIESTKYNSQRRNNLIAQYCGKKVKVRLKNGYIRFIEVSEYIFNGKPNHDIIEGKIVETNNPSDKLHTVVWEFVDNVEIIN